MAALIGLMSSGNASTSVHKDAYKIADAMMAERTRQAKGESA